MQRGIGGTAFEPLEKRRDREVTLGPTMLVLLGLGLFTLCGVCFVFGYAVGQHGSSPLTTGGAPGSTPSVTQVQNPTLSSKPAPSQSSFQPRPAADAPVAGSSSEPPPQTPDSGQSQSAQSALVPTQPPPSPVVSSSPASSPATSVVHTAQHGQTGGSQAGGVSGSAVRPAFSTSAVPAGMFMVQIAAVSHPEDADVLVSALRKRGYGVSVHRDPADALMHVEVGPFATRTDAGAMRQKLLNDGYNAIVQP